MPLTRDFRVMIRDRLERDPGFREALFEEGVQCLLAGEVDVGKSVLRDYVNATIGFQELGGLTSKSPKSLMRMLSPSGNPQASNLFEIIRCLQEREGLHLTVQAVDNWQRPMSGDQTSEFENWIRAVETVVATYRVACESLDRAVATVADQLPPLEMHRRGDNVIHRYPEKSIQVALALKLIQLRGNIRAGEKLIHDGLFLEWDAIQRAMHDALEDATLLASADGKDKVVRRYIDFFFDEDLDRNGELTDRRMVGVGREEVRKAIKRAAERHGLGDSSSHLVNQSRRLHRMRSGSVHGRAASIMRAYFEESVPTGLWLGGRRNRRRTAWELPSLHMMTSQTLSVFGLAGISRWWEPAYCLELIELGQGLQNATNEEIAALKAVVWADSEDDE